MADSKRQKIVDAVVALMGTILVTNGYSTDIGQTVADWNVNWQQDELPAISVCDLPATPADNSQNGRLNRTIWLMPIQIRVYAEKGTSPANVREMVKDVQNAIRTDTQFTVANVPLVMESWPDTEGFMIPDESFEIIGGTLQFTVMYRTGRFNPEQ